MTRCLETLAMMFSKGKTVMTTCGAAMETMYSPVVLITTYCTEKVATTPWKAALATTLSMAEVGTILMLSKPMAGMTSSAMQRVEIRCILVPASFVFCWSRLFWLFFFFFFFFFLVAVG